MKRFMINIALAACLMFMPTAHNTPPCPIPVPSNSSAPTSEVSVLPNKGSGIPFPVFNETEGAEEEEDRNSDTVPPVPIGPLRGTLTPLSDEVQPHQFNRSIISRQNSGNPVAFAVNTAFGDKVASGIGGRIPPDMSGAVHNNVVFATGNLFAALSIDGGTTFSYLNPSNIFPSTATPGLDGGLCCDQVVQYVEQIDRFIWLTQFWGSGGTGQLTGVNMLRIASASPADIIRDFNLGNYGSSGKQTSWTYWDLRSALFNLGNTTMDYPDMSVGTNYLYLSVDKIGTASISRGFLVARIPLSQIQSGGTINIRYTSDPSVSVSAYGGHVSQNTGDTVFWAGHSSSSQLQVFSFAENSDRYFWQFVNIASWCGDANFSSNSCQGDYSSTCPNGTIDWLAKLASFPKNGVIGTTRRFPGGNSPPEVWFSWTAPRVGGFPHPHVQVVKINTGGSVFSVIQQFQIWNSDFAFAYPYLSTNANQEVGISLGWGGNKFFANHAVGILGDFIVWYAELSDKCATQSSSTGPFGRWGDYATVRQATPKTKLYAATGYSVLTSPPPGSGQFNPRYILFGRQSDLL